MNHIFAPLITNLESIVQHGGYFFLSIITILEGVPIIGSLIPGHTVVIFSGFIAKLGIWNISIVVPLVIISAMLGDYSGYYLGNKYGYDFLKKFGKTLFIKDEYINRAKEIVNIHTGKAIIFGRFNPITRPLIPFIVGASKVHINRFWLYDFVGVFLWAVSSIFVGYIFGASYHIVAGYLGKFILIAIIASILIIWSYGFINKRFHIFAKYELIALILNLVGLYAFFKTVQDSVTEHAFLAELDIWINTFFASHFSLSGFIVMNIITDILSPKLLTGISLVLIVYLLMKRKWRYSLISILSVSGGLFLGGFIKEIVERSRPINSFIVETGFSFPSGHAIVSTVFFTLFIYIFAGRIKSWIIREIVITISIILVLLTAVSRLYLGVHWLSDVVAGCAFGLFWTTLMILSVRYFGLIYVSIKENWYKKSI